MIGKNIMSFKMSPWEEIQININNLTNKVNDLQKQIDTIKTSIKMLRNYQLYHNKDNHTNEMEIDPEIDEVAIYQSSLGKISNPCLHSVTQHKAAIGV